jgi:hypothetical protein
MQSKIFLLVVFVSMFLFVQTKLNGEIRPGKVWLDNRGLPINAHGGGILKYRNTYYWFGEYKSDTTSVAMVGVTCYSSKDLTNWTYRGIALPVSNKRGSDIEKGCILERPKVIFNARTGKFVMWFHLELKGQGYLSARYGVAVSNTPVGPYHFIRSDRSCPGVYPQNWKGCLNYSVYHKGLKMKWWTPEWIRLIQEGLFVQRDLGQGQMVRDQTVFVDDDGKAYHIFASEDNLTLQIAQLTDDYLDHNGKYWRMDAGGQNEAPVLFKKDGLYWMITSGCTGWLPNKARMFWAKKITGPWTQVDSPFGGPKAEITFGGQGTYVLKVEKKGTPIYVFMADIWRPKHPSDARYMWLPIDFKKGMPVISWINSWGIR